MGVKSRTMNEDCTLIRYILITPAKNEEENLPKVAGSILNQTILPSLWVIVDDGSTDKTNNYIKELEDKYEWIKGVRLKEGPRDLGIHISHVCREGFNFAIEYCKKHNIFYNYIGLVDADIILENTYFERLTNKFMEDPLLGIASAAGGNIVNGKLILNKKSRRDDLPSGGARLWSAKCFEETGGYLLTCAPDSVSNVKAMLRGWKTRRFKDIQFVSTRGYNSAEGLWKGYKQRGKNNYFLGYNIFYSLLKGIQLLFEKPHYIGMAYFYGYFSSLMLRKQQISDDEIRSYYKYARPREINQQYFNILRNKLKRA